MSFWGQSSDPPDREGSLSDTQLVVQAQAGNEAAFEMLYKRYFYRLYLFLARLTGNDDVGCELTQETFLKAWQNLSTLRNASTFLGWLYRIARNLACDHQRSTKNAHLTDSYDEKPQHMDTIITAGPEEQIEAEENVQLALARIPMEYRVCLILYHIEGYSKKQIAALMEIKESSVSTYISNGLRELRKHLHASIVPEDILSDEGRSEYE